MKQPPPDAIQAPIVHTIGRLYLDLYRHGTRVSKRDRYGIHRTIEDECLATLRVAIRAALEKPGAKTALVRSLTIEVELLKHLVRGAHEVGSILLPAYIEIQKRLQEISRDASAWLKYLERSEPR